MEAITVIPDEINSLIEKFNATVTIKDQACREASLLKAQDPQHTKIPALETQIKDVGETLNHLTNQFTTSIQKFLEEYSYSSSNGSIEFSSNLDGRWRKIVHDKSDEFGLSHESKGGKKNRKLVVCRQNQAVKKQKGLEFEDCPDPILEVEYASMNGNQIQIKFKKPDENGFPIQKYCLYLYNDQEGDFVKQNTSAETCFTLRDLQQSTQYIFEIAAQNQQGESDRRTSFKFMTPERFSGSVQIMGSDGNEVIHPSIFNHTPSENLDFATEEFIEDFITQKEQLRGKCLSMNVENTATALLNDGKVLQWGLTLVEADFEGPPNELQGNIIPIVSDPFYVFSEENNMQHIIIKSIHSGANFSIAIDIEGKVYSWGFNECGQLGLGDRLPRIAPTLVNFYNENAEVKKVFMKNIAIGGANVIALDDNGKVYIWGKMQAIYGQEQRDRFGNITSYMNSGIDQVKPRLVNEVLSYYKICKIAAGEGFNMALTKDGFLYSWGNNKEGQLGIGLVNEQMLENITVPRRVEYFEKDFTVIDVACGKNHSIALAEHKETKANRVFTWGFSKFGQCGHGDRASKILPTEVSFFKNKNIQQIKAGYRYSLVISQNENKETQVFYFGKVCDFKKFESSIPKSLDLAKVNLDTVTNIHPQKKNFLLYVQ